MDLNWGGGGGVIEKGHKERHIFTDYVVHVYFCEYIDYILPWYQRERHEFYEVHIVYSALWACLCRRTNENWKTTRLNQK